MSWVDLGPDVPDGELREALVGNRHLGVARCGDLIVAFDVWCTHDECPLTDGWLEGPAVRCACHGALFDLETGTALAGPTDEPLRLYPTRVQAGRVEADLSD